MTMDSSPTGFPKDFLWGGAVAANQCEGGTMSRKWTS